VVKAGRIGKSRLIYSPIVEVTPSPSASRPLHLGAPLPGFRLQRDLVNYPHHHISTLSSQTSLQSRILLQENEPRTHDPVRTPRGSPNLSSPNSVYSQSHAIPHLQPQSHWYSQATPHPPSRPCHEAKTPPARAHLRRVRHLHRRLQMSNLPGLLGGEHMLCRG